MIDHLGAQETEAPPLSNRVLRSSAYNKEKHVAVTEGSAHAAGVGDRESPAADTPAEVSSAARMIILSNTAYYAECQARQKAVAVRQHCAEHAQASFKGGMLERCLWIVCSV